MPSKLVENTCGHLDRPRTSTGKCRLCYYREWKATHPGYQKRRNEMHPGRVRRYKLKEKFGITPEAVNEMLALQSGKCAICHDDFRRTPHVDHCHTTGKVRGLLCGNCNTALGLVKDSPETLRNAIAYLEQ